MIKVDAATFRYEDMLMEFTLAVPRGSFMAVTGPSGSGKSTLLSLISGFEQPLSGDIKIAGRSMAGVPASNRPLSMIFQDNNNFGHLTIWQNVALGISPRLKLTAEQMKEVTTALQRVEIEPLKDRKPSEVSGGERQRIAIARTLVRRQPVMLLDEPFTALGPALREDMQNLLIDLRNERNLTIMLVTHQPDDVREKADLMAFVQNGRITHVLKPDEYFSQKAPAAVRSYLGN